MKTFTAHALGTFRITREITKTEIPSSNLITKIRSEYKKAKIKEQKLFLFIKALKENNYRFIQEQTPFVLLQEPNNYYSPIGVFLDICPKVIGWYIGEIINKNQQWVFPKWGNSYQKYNSIDPLSWWAEYDLLYNELGLDKSSIAEMNFLGIFNKMSYVQLANALEHSFRNKKI